MDKTLEELEREALQLSPESRASLAEKLIRSLEAEQDAAVGAAWVEEAERRYKAIQTVEVTTLKVRYFTAGLSNASWAIKTPARITPSYCINELLRQEIFSEEPV